MKKKNLATAMAAAMMFGGVAPVVAYANENDAVQPVQQGNNVNEMLQESQNLPEINMAMAEGKLIKANVAYADIHKLNGTLETADDILTLNPNQEILFEQGTVPTKLEKDVPGPTYLIATKMNEKELVDNKDAIETNKKNLETANNIINQLEKMTFKNKYGETKPVYEKGIKYDKLAAGTKTIVTLSKVKDAPSEYGEGSTLTFTNMKLEKDAPTLPTFESVAYDAGTKAGIEGLNEKVYDLKTNEKYGYTSENTEIQKTEKYNNETGHIDLTIAVLDKSNDAQLGTITLTNYDEFKDNNFKGYMDIAAIKDIKELDLPELNWAKDKVLDTLFKGQINGYEDNTIRMKNSVTRAEFARMLVELRGETVKEGTQVKENFTDVNKSDWFYNDVATLATLGIVSGDGNGTFRPNDTITRQEAAVMIARAINSGKDVDQFFTNTGKPMDTKTSFKDDKEIALWSDAAVRNLSDKKVINGYEDKTFRPENKITRAESIVMLNNSTNVAKDSLVKESQLSK